MVGGLDLGLFASVCPQPEGSGGVWRGEIHSLRTSLIFWIVGLSWSLGWEDPLEKGIATQSSTLAWTIPWTEEPGGLQSMGSQNRTQVND